MVEGIIEKDVSIHSNWYLADKGSDLNHNSHKKLSYYPVLLKFLQTYNIFNKIISGVKLGKNGST